MDFSILYRVLWNPVAVFKQYKNRSHYEPIIFIGIVALVSLGNAYIGHVDKLIEQPLLIPITLALNILSALFTPLINAALVVALSRGFIGKKVSFVTILCVSILCEMPTVAGTLIIFVGNFPSIGLNAFTPSLAISNPFLYGMLATITPFFLWMLILWWFGMNQLLTASRRQCEIVVGIIALLNIILGGAMSRVF